MILAKSTTTTPTTTTVNFTVDYPNDSIVHGSDPTIDLDGREWVHEFAPDEATLIMVFTSAQQLEGWAAPLDENGRYLEGSKPVLLERSADGTLIYVCTGPESGEGPRIELSFVLLAAATGAGKLPSQPRPFIPPTQANPTMTLKPKRTSPASGKSGPQTGDD